MKLWQMPADDTRTVRIDTRDPSAWQRDGPHEVCRLHGTDHEQVSLVRLPPGHRLRPDAHAGAELLVIEGQLDDGACVLGPLGWLRLPPGRPTELRAGVSGATLYLKTGHLAGLAS